MYNVTFPFTLTFYSLVPMRGLLISHCSPSYKGRESELDKVKHGAHCCRGQMLTLKIEFDTVAVTDAVRQLPNSWACSVSDKYDIIKTA